MANEYLKRTPTSTGNNKVFTWAGWVKRNKFSNAYVGSQNLFRSSGGSGGDCGWRFDYSTPSDGLRVHLNGSSAASVEVVGRNRDAGSWLHVMLAFDSTQNTSTDRVKIYVNGNLTSADAYYPTINFETSWNESAILQSIGSWNGNTEFFHGEMFDVFLVDGQALTPEVFGYYKDGEGYISAGTSQATDFRNGKWTPKKPQLIIDEINESGGFGVNGFYLPMNSSNNFGADFHTTPNTILKLKDNLPQPKAEIDGSGDYSGDVREELGGLPFAGVVKFDGSGDYLEIPNNTDFDLGSEWTIEFWLYPITSQNGKLLGTRGDSSPRGWEIVYWNNQIGIEQYGDQSTGGQQRGSTPLSTKKWYHISICFSSGVVKTYINGVLDLTYSGSSGSNWGSGGHVLRIGKPEAYEETPNVYLSNLRILKGTALYTENFTPPKYKLEKIPNTVLLCCNSKTDATNEETGKTITKNGDVYATTSELTDALVLALPFVSGGLQNGFGDYSAAIRGYGSQINPTFQGTNNIELISGYYGSAARMNGSNGILIGWGTNDPKLNFGSGDWTMEAWVYTNSTPSGYWSILRSKNYNDSTSSGIAFYGYQGGIRIWKYEAGYLELYPGTVGTIPNQQWTHVVLEKNQGFLTTYVNGVSVATVDNSSSSYVNNGFEIGQTFDWDGYIQDVRIYKGVAKYKGGFDVPKPYTPVNFASWRAVPDTTANNFATLNPLIGNYTDANFFSSDGNLSITVTNNSGYRNYASNFSPENFKGYLELRWSTGTPNGYIGVTDVSKKDDNLHYTTAGTFTIVANGDAKNGLTIVKSGCTPSFSNGDILQIAFDFTGTNKNIWFGRNGTWGDNTIGTGNPSLGINPIFTSTDLTEEYRFHFAINTGAGTQIVHLNFGQNPTFSGNTTAGTFTDSNGKGLFKYQPPTGFLALCEDNLPTLTISDPGKHFKTVLYTGSQTPRSIQGLGFQPDLVWIKVRSEGGSHVLFDSVRGPALQLLSNSTNAEATDTNNLTSFDDNGFSLGSGYTTVGTNGSGRTYAAWCWKAGGEAVTNTDGSITSQVSANQTAGFSIATYTATGSTGSIGHGLGKTPAFVITKHRNLATHWRIWHKSLTAYDYTLFFNTGAQQSQPAYSALPTSSVINLAGDLTGAYDFVTYSWAEIDGYSRFGTYVGNDSTDGPFVYCGFKPALVILKASSTTGNWCMIDNARNPTNPTNLFSVANTANAGDDTGGLIDFVSNGFKLRLQSPNFNGNGVTYIFAAFAESPFQNANAK